MKVFIYLLFVLLLFSFAAAIEDCPLGLINDTAPGSCVLYIDKNADALCDLSQPDLNDSCDTNISITDLTSTEIKSMTVGKVAEHYGIDVERFATEISKVAGFNVKASDSFQNLHDNYAVKPVNVREIALALSSSSMPIITIEDSPKQSYYVLPIIIITVLLYLSTWYLSKKDKITILTHRKIWNWLLLITFIPVLISSLLWLLRIEYGIIISVPFNISYWHIIFGLIMIIISIFHILWHIKYYAIKKSK